jgi:ACS family sodium-dependent inorganic phosphate cotransporter
VCADALVEKNIASTLFVRRAFQAFGMVGPAVCLLAAAWLGHGGVDGRVADANVLGAAVCVDVGLALSALTLAGVSVSHLDVAPKHAGLVFATGNTCATIAGLIAVPVSGLILERTNQNWSVVFGVIAAVFVLGAAVWCAWVGDEPVAADDVVKETR